VAVGGKKFSVFSYCSAEVLPALCHSERSEESLGSVDTTFHLYRTANRGLLANTSASLSTSTSAGAILILSALACLERSRNAQDRLKPKCSVQVPASAINSKTVPEQAYLPDFVIQAGLPVSAGIPRASE